MEPPFQNDLSSFDGVIIQLRFESNRVCSIRIVMYPGFSPMQVGKQNM